MKKITTFLVALAISVAFVSTQAHAKDTNTYMNTAYWKGGEMFDVVVKQTPGLKMKLYVNDKNPVETTVNDEGWATFSKVKMSGEGKISFTWVDGQNKEYPIDYTSKFNITDPKVTFSEEPSAAPTPAATPTPAPKSQIQATPAPAPVEQSSVYYKNCTAARAAGAAPVHRGQPGYASHLDRDNDGIGCE